MNSTRRTIFPLLNLNCSLRDGDTQNVLRYYMREWKKPNMNIYIYKTFVWEQVNTDRPIIIIWKILLLLFVWLNYVIGLLNIWLAIQYIKVCIKYKIIMSYFPLVLSYDLLCFKRSTSIWGGWVWMAVPRTSDSAVASVVTPLQGHFIPGLFFWISCVFI